MYPDHIAGLGLEALCPGFLSILFSTAHASPLSSFICKETIYFYSFCCLMCILWRGRWGFLKSPLYSGGNALMYCKEKYMFFHRRLRISHL